MASKVKKNKVNFKGKMVPRISVSVHGETLLCVERIGRLCLTINQFEPSECTRFG